MDFGPCLFLLLMFRQDLLVVSEELQNKMEPTVGFRFLGLG